MGKGVIMAKDLSATKSLVAYERIRDLIISGEKLPGTRLVIAELETELAIGRGAIREALMRLDRSGLVRNMPYKGMVVAAPPQLCEIEYIYKVRSELEVFLALEAMHNLGEADFAVLDDFIQKFEGLQKFEGTFFSLDRRFHSFIYQASSMVHICSIVDKIMDTIEVYLNLYTYEDADQTVFVNEHKQIVALLKAKQGDELAAVMKRNIMGGLRLVENAYSKIVRPAR